MKCNVLEEDKLCQVHEHVLSRFGRIDILINAAGGHVAEAIIGIDQSVFDLKIEHFKKVTDLNLHGTVLPTLIFGKTMAAQRSGSIINMTPFKRFGTPDELIGATLWLASDASKFVTGTVIPVDGGFSVFSGV